MILITIINILSTISLIIGAIILLKTSLEVIENMGYIDIEILGSLVVSIAWIILSIGIYYLGNNILGNIL